MSPSSESTTTTPNVPSTPPHPLHQLLNSLKIPPDLARYDAIALAADGRVPSTEADLGGGVNPDIFKNINPDTLKNLGNIDEGNPTYAELTAHLAALNVEEPQVTEESVNENKALRARLDDWMVDVRDKLAKLREVITGGGIDEVSISRSREEGEETEFKEEEIALKTRAEVVFTVAAFTSDDEEARRSWNSSASNAIANDILKTFLNPNALPLPLLESLLNHLIRPIFQTNLHPKINPATGRKLPRSAGGPLASQDFYESQRWKEYPAIGNVILWCVKHTERDYYETIWHLLIPPIMTMLDDYEAKYKLSGVKIVREVMKTVPGTLLKRTGIDGLTRSALTACLTHLQSEETPPLLRESINAQVELTLLTTKPGEKAYFEQLCDVLGEGIISGVWFYGSDKEDAIVASTEALPRLVRALGIGSVRYLQVGVTSSLINFT
ncbi:hypothetical protein AX17_004968 [Amanita inopinata Kibby_2008]|nr:hypothetical protein AX17_004968 [Amanita inopinata Kibby_2008]